MNNSNQSPLMGGAKERRHKWVKEINHPCCHRYVCQNGCGTVKDSTSMTNTFYLQNGEKRFDAGACTTGGEDNVASPSNSGDASVVSLPSTVGNSVGLLRTKIIETTSRMVKDHDADEVRGMTEVPMRFIKELDELLFQLDTAETTASKTHPHE